jgi:hypothetical protein
MEDLITGKTVDQNPSVGSKEANRNPVAEIWPKASFPQHF